MTYYKLHKIKAINFAIFFRAYFTIEKITMRRLSKDSEDLQSERSSNTYNTNVEEEYAKSFQTGQSRKFVNVTLPSIFPS